MTCSKRKTATVAVGIGLITAATVVTLIAGSSTQPVPDAIASKVLKNGMTFVVSQAELANTSELKQILAEPYKADLDHVYVVSFATTNGQRDPVQIGYYLRWVCGGISPSLYVIDVIGEPNTDPNTVIVVVAQNMDLGAWRVRLDTRSIEWTQLTGWQRQQLATPSLKPTDVRVTPTVTADGRMRFAVTDLSVRSSTLPPVVLEQQGTTWSFSKVP